jgi:hypothetical protein
MPSRNWKDIAELIGIGAIVASLIFVGLQMQQSQEIAIGAQYQDRANVAIENYMSQIQSNQALRYRGQWLIDAASSDNYPIVVKNLIETAGPESVAITYLLYRSRMAMMDNCHFQYESGFMTEDAWLAMRRRLKKLLSDDVFAAMYHSESWHFRSSFQEESSQLLAELDAR